MPMGAPGFVLLRLLNKKTMSDSEICKVSLILLAYNQEAYIREAVSSCLRQETRHPIEIVLSDDASSDSTFEIISRLAAEYAGPHKVVARRNPTNLGIGAHVNACIAHSSGELIVFAAGDDISRPERVQRLVDKWEETGRKVDLLTSDLVQIDAAGAEISLLQTSDLSLWDSPEKWIRKRPFVIGAAHATTRRLHEIFGDFGPKVVQEDQLLSFRACLQAGGAKINEPLVHYRVGGISQQKRAAVTADGYLNWSRRQYSREAAQYEQIRNDLVRAQRQDLWDGKLARRLSEATFVMGMHGAVGASEKFRLLAEHPHARLGFRLKHALLISFPGFAARLQRLQMIVKGKS